MNKKIILCLFVLLLTVTLTGCGTKKEEQNNNNNNNQQQEENNNQEKEQEYTIVDKTESMDDFVCLEALQQFYEDDNYRYSYSCIKSDYVVVKYKDGTEITVKDALASKKITISDLDKFNIKYYKEEKNNNPNDDDVIIDPEEYEEDDHREEGTITVEKVINCDGCVYAYFSAEGDEAKKLGSTLTPSEYTTDINNLKTAGNRQRHNFFGLILDGNTISRAYACILKDNKIYCIEGSTNGAYHNSNIAILNQVFNSDQCRTISDGNTYTCSDGSYNGDTKTNGYASMHYETSCTIYSTDSNAGKLICH